MIILPGKINNRNILYLQIGKDLGELETTNLTNWVVLVIEDNINNPILETFANSCIDKNVLYIHATGKACDEIEDLFDLEIILRQVKGEKLPIWMISEDDVLMTSWDYNFEDAFWFITKAAYYGDNIINTVLVANLTDEDLLEKIQALIKKINFEGM